jgi:dTMP kinase
MSPSKHKFITIEGGEGSGKSTLVRRLQEHLTAQNIAHVVTREPGGSLLGESIRTLLLHQDPTIKIDPMAELLLFLSARAQHLEQLIRPSLAQDKIVLCDRFNDSTVAYQGAARKLDPKKVETLCEMVCEGTLPTLTLLLDIDPRIGLERAMRSRQAMDRMESEKISFHDAVRQGFLNLAEGHPERILRIDATQTPDQVFEQALKAF